MWSFLKDPLLSPAIKEAKMNWNQYAQKMVAQAIAEGSILEDPAAICAARALIPELEGHPSYYNTQFAIAAFVLDQAELTLCAWKMVVNGLGGYWQWETHNGGKFSVTKALLHLKIATSEEASDISRFNVRCTHKGCNYYEISPAFLRRLIEKFQIPTIRADIGGKTTLSPEKFRDREWLVNRYEWHKVSLEGEERLAGVKRTL